MSTSERAVHPTAELIAFAANGWAFRDAVRGPARAFVLVTLVQAMASARAPRVEIAAADAPGPARMRAHAIGRAAVTTPLRAAFVTGVAAGEAATLTTPVVCAAFALGEIVAGTEIAVRVERALGAGHRERGWDTHGTCGRLGAAVAAARVLGLQREAMRDAFGIAATAACGLREARGTMTAAYIVGAAAADGIEAALLARAEFTAAPLALEGRRGLAALMSPTFDGAALVQGLGETFLMESLAAGPTGSPNGPAYDAVRALVDRIERLPSIRELIDATLAAS